MVRFSSSGNSDLRKRKAGDFGVANLVLRKAIIVIPLLLIVVGLIQGCFFVVQTRTVAMNNNSADQLIEDLISWLQSNGAFIDERISIRHVDPTDPTSIRGMFADHGSFDAGETMIIIPDALIYDGRVNEAKKNADKVWMDKKHGDCATTYEIHDAMLTGSTPYGRYLAHQPHRYVPGYFSSEGRELLRKILGKNLPDQHAVEDSVKIDWLDWCTGATSDELEVHAAMLVTARADGRLMVPYYDMINHRNGRWQNAQHHRSKNKEFALITNQKVEKGEQFYLSYDTCKICGSRLDSWGTPEMFRGYGFVEPFPQRYLIHSVRLKFALDEKKSALETSKRHVDKVGNNSELVVKWYIPPSQAGLDFLQMELNRLQEVGTRKDVLKGNPQAVTDSEWNAIWTYHQALVVAFTTALKHAPAEQISDEVWSMGKKWYNDLSGDDMLHRFY
eukprot:CAMPEP_0198137724 /NCGR_PEP_ID=MMETSP1443-20131203/1179_1 /TAXON_ID=186043 /ORGANISM="Entomoneis sp., Strain CCMP2396" /LENGTH=445 /DNA_ID=CAMNT_0043799245 /DNA_START=37 /DNA_END=1374 /DNA_ORIENTATION=+